MYRDLRHIFVILELYYDSVALVHKQPSISFTLIDNW